MFLDNRQAAMDSALEALAESLDYFYDNTSRLDDSVRSVLTPHFEARRSDVIELRRLSRELLKLLPRDADVERDDYLWLWSRLKSFVGDNDQVLLHDMLEQEKVIMQALARALTHPLPDEIEPVMERIFRGCRNLIRQLYDAQQQAGQAKRSRRGRSRRARQR